MHFTTATPRTSGVRSANGCWTCRLRRKKCDEARPSCQICANLGIDCEGYGPRPQWMDRGQLEREKAEAVKAEIAQAGSKRRRISVGHKSVSSETSIKPPISDSFDKRRPSSAVRFEGAVHLPQTQMTPKPVVHPSPSHREGVESLTDDWLDLISPRDEPSADGIMGWHNQVLPTRQDSGPISPLNNSSHEFSLDQYSISGELDLQNMPSPLPTFPSESHRLPGDFGQDIRGGGSVSKPWGKIELQADSIFGVSNMLGTVHQGLGELLPASSIHSPSPLDLGLTVGSGRPDLQTAIVLSHYFNVVLPEQFPPWLSPDAMNRQWLQVLTYSSKHLREITLILSQAHHSRKFYADASRACAPDLCNALNILRTLPSSDAVMCMRDEAQRAMQAVVACACVYQVIYLELSYGSGGHWQQCMNQAGSYTQILIDIVVRGGIDADRSEPLAMATEQTLLAAAKTLLARLMWLDTVATVSTGTISYLQINHSHLLGLDSVDMAGTSGCEDWAVKELHEIACLHEWKKRAESKQKLNIMQLATRGAAILQSLEEKMVGLSETAQQQVRGAEDGDDSDKCANCSHNRKCAVTWITMAFAQAAVIYLHVVLSGPLPYLQEIRAAHSELRSALNVLAGRDLIGHAAWPLCVAACFMTDDEDADAILATVLSGLDEVKTRRLCIEALDIGQKCREARKAGESTDWISTIKALQTYILLA